MLQEEKHRAYIRGGSMGTERELIRRGRETQGSKGERGSLELPEKRGEKLLSKN